MDCKEFQARLDQYVGGELSAEFADEAREHLKGCASCARSEAGLRNLRSSLRRVVNRHQPPPGLEHRVLTSLRSGRRDPAERAGRTVDEGGRVGTHLWRAKVVVPAPFFALLLLSVVALAGWLVFARAPSPAPTGEAPGTYFSRYNRGERATIQVVRRASLKGGGR